MCSCEVAAALNENKLLIMAKTELVHWEVISLLCWKNFCTFWNNRVSFLISIFSPATFVFFLIILRFTISVERRPTIRYPPIYVTQHWSTLLHNNTLNAAALKMHTNGDFDHSVFIPQNILGYAPSDSEAAKLVMDIVSELLHIPVEGYFSAETLDEAIIKHHYLAGVEFTGFEGSKEHIPNHLHFTLVYPSEIRNVWNFPIGSNWCTNWLFDPYFRHYARYPDAADGGYIGYSREGFVAMQSVISNVFISLRAKINTTPIVKLRRFPLPATEYDRFLDEINFSLSMAILVGFLYPTTNLIKYIVEEKELLLKDGLNIYGVSETAQFTAWFIKGMAQFVVGSLIAVFLLKVGWSDGNGLFTRSSWTPLMLFMIAYNLATVSFCYLMSTFFQRPSTAIVIHSIVWIFTYFPYTLTSYKHNMSISTFIFSGLFSNSVMAVGLDQILEFEKFSKGFNLYDLIDLNDEEELYMPINVAVLILLLQAVAYAGIGIAIEMNKRKKFKKEQTPSRESTGSGSKVSGVRSSLKGRSPAGSFREDPAVTSKLRSKTEVIEIESSNKKVNVEIKHLSLTIDRTRVVDDVTMDLYEGEISVIMGTNGSGKSLLLSMIIGRIVPSSGSVIISGVDITNNGRLSHSYVGVSLNLDMLYPNLTVSDQLTFFCRMKGYQGERLQNNIRKYLKAMNLTKKADQLTYNLTEGIKQHLCACCTLVGGSKFVIMDQPSSAMDIASRKLLWDMLIKEKRHRTILIATNSIDEAEILADRIGIMVNGKLKCFGSVHFLKSFYAAGQRLKCSKGKDFNADALTDFIRDYIPKIVPECNLGSEISYKIIHEDIDKLVNLLSAMEKQLAELKLESISISDLTFEDVFLSMCEDENKLETQETQFKRIMNGYSIYVKEYESSLFLQKGSSGKSQMNELRAVFLQRWYYMKGNKVMTMLKFLLPILVMGFSIYIPTSSMGKEIMMPRTYRLKDYKSSISVVERKDKTDRRMKYFARNYEKMVESMGSVHTFEETDRFTMEEYMAKQQESQDFFSQSKYLVGATFSHEGVTAWFNNYPLHTIPLSLNIVYNAILQSYRSDSKITIVLRLLPNAAPNAFDPDQTTIQVDLANSMAFHLAFVLCSINAIRILVIILARTTTFKLLQFVNGLRPSAHLIGSFLFDLLTYIVVAAAVFFAAWILAKDEFGFEVSTYYFVMLIVFVFCMTNFAYLMGSFFDNPITGNIVILLFTVYGAILFVTLMELHEQKYAYYINLDEKILWFMRLFPVFAFCTSLNKIIGAAFHRRACDNEDVKLISIVLKDCKDEPNCCVSANVLEWGNPYCIIPDIISILMFGIICMICYFIVEYMPDMRVSSIGSGIKKRESVSLGSVTESLRNYTANLNDTVKHEKREVIWFKSNEYPNKPLVLNNVSKAYDNRRIAINQLYLKVEHGECIGILGINGSGKTTLFKLLAGYESASVGEIFVKGIDMRANIYDLYKHTGLCPKTEAIPAEFTVYQAMRILCILRGVPDIKILLTCESLARVLNFIDNLHTKYGKLSSGNKLRVCAAISMIGSPTIMYYDVVTSGIDPSGRRQLCNIYGKMLEMGKSLLFTSLDVSECSRICTRVAIMDDGAFQYLDTPYNLSNNNMRGCLLYVQVKPRYAPPKQRLSSESAFSGDELLSVPSTTGFSPSILSPFLKVQTFVEREYQSAVVKDQRGLLITFYIPGDKIPMSEIYLKMGRNAFNLNVSHFWLTRDTLDILFCELAEAKEDKSRYSEMTV